MLKCAVCYSAVMYIPNGTCGYCLASAKLKRANKRKRKGWQGGTHQWRYKTGKIKKAYKST